MPGTKIALLEVSALVRDALGAELTHAGFSVTAHAGSIEYLREVEVLQPAVALVDLAQVEDPFLVLGLLRQAAPNTRIVALVWGGDARMVDSLIEIGVSRLLNAQTEGLEAVLAAIGEGTAPRLFPVGAFFNTSPSDANGARPGPRLSAREREVLGCITGGHDNLKIAAELGICERTVKAHVSSLYRKLELENRTQLALRGLEPGLAPPMSSPVSSAAGA